MVTVLYRGGFQGRRLQFLLDVLRRVHGDIELIWLHPNMSTATPWFEQWVRERPWVVDHKELDGSLRALPFVTRTLRRRCRRQSQVVYAIGSMSLPYARVLSPTALVWCINGIPEERLLYDKGPLSRAAVRAEWLVARAGRRPDLVVTVSDPMGKLISRWLPGVRWVKAPTCVELQTFRPSGQTNRSYLTYVGSGAPWQCLDLLGAVWQALHRIDPGLRFRVISRDDRSRVLHAGLPDSAVELHGTNSPTEIARMLWEAEIGFLIRTPNIVNTASFPTKFGEYVAADVPVVSTDIGWEISSIIRETGCGLIVDWRADAAAIAHAVASFRARATADTAIREGCRRAAAGLDRTAWIESLSGHLLRVLPRPANG
jgi:glycosyltransferase involved in cell wall biosynthesis